MMTILSNPLITVAPGEILVEMVSWLSFVERWPVLIQLFVVLVIQIWVGKIQRIVILEIRQFVILVI